MVLCTVFGGDEEQVSANHHWRCLRRGSTGYDVSSLPPGHDCLSVICVVSAWLAITWLVWYWSLQQHSTLHYPANASGIPLKNECQICCKYPQTSEWNGFRIISDLVYWCEGNEFPKHKKDRKLSKNVAPFCEQLVQPNLYERVRKSFRNSTAVELRILCLAQSSSKVAFGCNKLFCKSILVSSLFFISALS